eukprot:scaffold19113_cov98-Isochrysis_galbana.AAC.5
MVAAGFPTRTFDGHPEAAHPPIRETREVRVRAAPTPGEGAAQVLQASDMKPLIDDECPQGTCWRFNGGKSQLGRYWEDKFSSRRSSNEKKSPTVEREGPVTPIYGPFDCWQNPQSTPPNQPIVMPVHPPHVPLAPMYPPDFDVPTTAPQTPQQ